MTQHDDATDEYPCGLCGQTGADKMVLWTGGGVYWPGEQIPDTEMVHQECEQAETQRAHAALTAAAAGCGYQVGQRWALAVMEITGP